MSNFQVEEGRIQGFIIPQCCREGSDTCPHVAKKFRKNKQNIGL